MSKKPRRTRAQAPRVVPAETIAPQPVRLARPPRAPAEHKAKDVDFQREYHYVIEDLKRIALFAAAMFALLIVMALAFRFMG